MFVVANEDCGNQQWAAPWRAKLTGFSASGGSFTITFNSSTTSVITYDAGESLTSIATKINRQAVKKTAVGFKGLLTSNWLMKDYIVVNKTFTHQLFTTFTQQ